MHRSRMDGSRLSRDQARAAVALAEAIIPGSTRLAAADFETATRAEALLGHVSPWARSAWARALTALDAAAIAKTGRKFHRLSVAEQESVLRGWEQNPMMRAVLQAVSFALKFVHFDRPEVYASMGGALNVVDHLESPRWLDQIHVADEWPDAELECEVVVVGTGAGGAVVGRELAEQGLAVVFVEEGSHHRRDAFTGSSVEAHARFYRGAASVGNAPMPIFMGRLVGGSTAINTGTCFRTPPHVLDEWCEALGTRELSPERMERHFSRVEATIRAEPADPRYVGAIRDIIARGCEKLGWTHGPVVRNAPGCRGEGFCDFGCRTDARQSTNLSYVPPALERGAMMLTRLRARGLIVENGRAVGVYGTTPTGRVMRVRAPTVILAGGAIPTPVLLLQQGICNGSRQVGRNLSVHPSGAMLARFDEDIRGPRHIPQGHQVDEFLPEGILIVGAQTDYNYFPLVVPLTGRRLMREVEAVDHTVGFGVLIRDASRGRVRVGPTGAPLITYNLGTSDVQKLHRGLVKSGELARAAGARALLPAVLPGETISTDRDWARFVQTPLTPSQLLLTSYHPLGTCRMSRDPASGVVDLDHAAHELPGLFIVDGSTVPGPPSVNPQVTIMALATRAAERIAARVA
jgi:choline dehydrogenase-like flavoprotein